VGFELGALESRLASVRSPFDRLPGAGAEIHGRAPASDAHGEHVVDADVELGRIVLQVLNNALISSLRPVLRIIFVIRLHDAPFRLALRRLVYARGVTPQ
jgi:hypothetical protein